MLKNKNIKFTHNYIKKNRNADQSPYLSILIIQIIDATNNTILKNSKFSQKHFCRE